jgi:hypothetical protein
MTPRTLPLSAVPASFGGWDAIVQSARAQNAANEGRDPCEQAGASTRVARDAIRAIRCISEREVAEILACVQARISESGWSHTEDAVAADEALTECIYYLEQQACRSES